MSNDQLAGNSSGVEHSHEIDYAVKPDDLKVTYFEPTAALSLYVLNIYYFQCAAKHIRDKHPAGMGRLAFTIKGECNIKFANGESYDLNSDYIYGPASAAAESTISGPFATLGVILTPLGFVALTGKGADECTDKVIDAAELFGSTVAPLSDKIKSALISGKDKSSHIVNSLEEFFMATVRPVKPDHVMVIQKTKEWLSASFNPSVDDLLKELPDMSRSKVTRLMRRYCGSAPKAFMRKFRAMRAASNLVDPNLDHVTRKKIDALFFDKSHMIREIAHYIGRTPKELDGEEGRIMRMWLSRDNYRDIRSHLSSKPREDD